MPWGMKIVKFLVEMEVFSPAIIITSEIAGNDMKNKIIIIIKSKLIPFKKQMKVGQVRWWKYAIQHPENKTEMLMQPVDN